MKIVVVCFGNACRSAVCACILTKMLAEAGIDEVDVYSCGTLEWASYEHDRDEVMVKVAKEHGYELTGKTTYMSEEILNDADLVLVMNPMHRDAITQVMAYDHWDRIQTFCKYCFGEEGSITDPSGGIEPLYRQVFEKIEAGCTAIIDKLNLTHPWERTDFK